MIRADSACDDICTQIILGSDGKSREAAQHGDLADVGESVSNRTLENLLGTTGQRRMRSQAGVERGERTEKPIDVLCPRQRLRIAVLLPSFREGGSPIKQVANMRENFPSSARFVAGAEPGEFLWRSAKRFPSAIGESRECVAKQFASGVRSCRLGCAHGRRES